MAMNGENAKLIFQGEPPNIAIDLGARILLELLVSFFVNFNKATHIF